MILFNVVFALRVREAFFFVVLHLFIYLSVILALWVWCRRLVFVSDNTLFSISEFTSSEL